MFLFVLKTFSNVAVVAVFLRPGGVMVTKIVRTRKMSLTPASQLLRMHVTQHTSDVSLENVFPDGGDVITKKTVTMEVTRLNVSILTTEFVQRRSEPVTMESVSTLSSGVMV